MKFWVANILAKQGGKALGRLTDRVLQAREIKRLRDYVEKDNELDKQMRQVQKNQNKILKNQELMEKEIATLKKDSHPRADWICMDCGCNAKKVEIPTKKLTKKEK
tara:strand:- start:242 stop:559 length:318 start_codon:yes stop_codon:yes gene_type:complete